MSGGFGSLVEGLRRDIGAIGPGERAALDEKPTEVNGVLQGLEHGPAEQIGKVRDAVDTVIEQQAHDEIRLQLGAHEDWNRVHGHSAISAQRRNLLERLTSLRPSPVCFQFEPARNTPLPNKARCRPGVQIASQWTTIERERRISALEFSVEVGDSMLLVVHAKEDAKE
ncbi:MAG TPA: hypothetical protein VFO11_03115 [Candidatus Polarisedimenticolaceae bacterium]|nr:hypothetical protein [Candidatus Polarisedimenticolaceae bacterium]